MSADGTPGSKNQPQFLDGGAPDLATDSNTIADYAAKVGNRKIGTTAERDALTGKDVWEGLEWWDLNLSAALVKMGTAWIFAGGKVPYCTYSRTSSFTNIPNGTLYFNDAFEGADGRGFTKAAGVVTIATAGVYTISFGAGFAANGTGARQGFVSLNSTSGGFIMADEKPAAPSGATTVGGTVTRVFAAGDVLRVGFYQTSGGLLNTDTSVPFFLSAAYIGPV